MKKINYTTEITIVAILTVLLVAIVAAYVYVASYYNLGKGYEWDSKASTSAGLPVMFATCDLHFLGNYEKSCETNIMLYGDEPKDELVSIGCSGSGGDRDRELYPNSAKILYYSFNENKFYSGSFNLDYNKILTVAETMRNAVLAQEGPGKVQTIVFSTQVYPGGKVVISMRSYLETSVKAVVVGTFLAKPEKHDWSVMGVGSNSDSKIISSSNSIEIQRALLLNKYNWEIAVELPTDCDFESLDVGIYGNKALKMDTLQSTKTPLFGNFVYLPKQLSLEWQRKDTVAFNAWFEFDEQEIIKAFETVDPKGANNSITMKLIVKDDSTALKAILSGNGKVIAIKNKDTDSQIRSRKIYN